MFFTVFQDVSCSCTLNFCCFINVTCINKIFFFLSFLKSISFNSICKYDWNIIRNIGLYYDTFESIVKTEIVIRWSIAVAVFSVTLMALFTAAIILYWNNKFGKFLTFLLFSKSKRFMLKSPARTNLSYLFRKWFSVRFHKLQNLHWVVYKSSAKLYF